MVQFNLLPDVKYQHLKAKRLERLVVTGASLLVGVCIVILVLLILWIDVWQKHTISSDTANIKTAAAKIKSIDGLNNIITVQNQLATLPGLYAQDPQTSRLFTFVTKITPPNVTIGDLSLDFTQNTMEIKGSAPGLDDVNAYTDSLKKATYDNKTSGATDQPAFSNVVLSSFSRSQQGATYTIDLNFDPTLFQPTQTINLSVPKTTNLPQVPGVNGQLFKALPTCAPNVKTDCTGGSS